MIYVLREDCHQPLAAEVFKAFLDKGVKFVLMGIFNIALLSKKHKIAIDSCQ